MRDADATDAARVRYQIKGRRLTTHNNSRQLGALRDLSAQGFDVLAAVLFQEDYRVLKAALIPHARIGDLAKRVERTNSWRFLLVTPSGRSRMSATRPTTFARRRPRGRKCW